ncbi:16S rRNA (adenine(1518)-N(6)/adenine(1519)-N(6))-dimethyltransferase RsmA [Altibacter sp. HG106]|uniref:16S rRNA (adenine(1518)-N(6)/adenine(1519)-N(6))- dimethyltransferase RsmA n=1 Tax=Altibacter sp. HG106 TaxID=3023937 RepID=UPI0023500CE1|nr:16S rRNA (adenine(1518)-N(6)/adenine(1519)-N(6))-dimethyltransferase RsmA [Altibacter sp. HG106]MDC7994786.1 16S rRNA (adenine(1518)-N(6)/adenine(1519)-N(6))-dimethyltransferase RsmA [Altibacter sp. HG106]
MNDRVRPKKHLGQHFLHDTGIAKRIADTLTLEGYEQVLEIGPGMGVLTQFLLEKKLQLTAMDVDTESVAFLEAHFESERLTVLEADFLKFPLETIYASEAFAITGNFPYNISSQIVFKALEHRAQVPEFTGMFQKEVAQRICASEGSKTYGILSVLVQAFYDTEYLFTVKPGAFSPPPKVDSGVLRLRRKKEWTLPVSEPLFFKVVKTAFQQRRKTLRNSLKAFNLSAELKEDAIFGQRPEQLSVPEFIALTQKIANDGLSTNG